MFAVVYSSGSVALPAFDPDVGINFAMMVHGGQEFVWGEPVCAGDVITTVDEREGHLREGRDGLLRVRVGVDATRTAQEVVRGTWTNIVRGVS